MVKTNKQKKTITVEERMREAHLLMEQLSTFGMSAEHKGIFEFTKILKSFQDQGISGSGKIKLFGLQRILKYTLSMQPHVVSNIVLEFDPTV